MMHITDINACPEFLAGDSTLIREILHPGRTVVPIGYSLAHARLAPGTSSIRHKLTSSEVYYILEGEGTMHIDEASRTIKKDHLVFIPPNAVQYIVNTGSTELRFLCIVEPAWRKQEDTLVP